MGGLPLREKFARHLCLAAGKDPDELLKRHPMECRYRWTEFSKQADELIALCGTPLEEVKAIRSVIAQAYDGEPGYFRARINTATARLDKFLGKTKEFREGEQMLLAADSITTIVTYLYDVEGWGRVVMSDGSEVTVPPSKLHAIDKAALEIVIAKTQEAMTHYDALVSSNMCDILRFISEAIGETDAEDRINAIYARVKETANA